MAAHQFLSSFGIKLLSPTLLHDEDDVDDYDGDNDENVGSSPGSILIWDQTPSRVCFMMRMTMIL